MDFWLGDDPLLALFLDLLKLRARLENKVEAGDDDDEVEGADEVSSEALAELESAESDGVMMAAAVGGVLVEFCLRNLSNRFAAKPIALAAFIWGKSSFLAAGLEPACGSVAWEG